MKTDALERATVRREGTTYRATPFTVNAEGHIAMVLAGDAVLPAYDYERRATIEVQAVDDQEAARHVFFTFQNDEEQSCPDGGPSIFPSCILQLEPATGGRSWLRLGRTGWKQVEPPSGLEDIRIEENA